MNIDGNFIGDEVWFHVRDNGAGRGDPSDQISVLILETETPSSEIFTCETQLQDVFSQGSGSANRNVLSVELTLYCNGDSEAVGSQDNDFVFDHSNGVVSKVKTNCSPERCQNSLTCHALKNDDI